ncbi:MAG: radical SAM protein [Phycisphaerales bacterium]|nr:radical SAM protein [Phycisphaerales bacterium]
MGEVRSVSRLAYGEGDFAHSPLLVFYEVTRACNLLCVHCRADAQRKAHPLELRNSDARKLIDQLTTFPRPPLLVLTGGDPIKREDIFDLVRYASKKGLEVAMTPSATPLVTGEVIERLHDEGLHRFAVSLDGADAATHDGFRRVPGSFARTLAIIEKAIAVGLPVQINTTIAQHNVEQVERIAEVLERYEIVLWSVFFLVPTGRGLAGERLSGEQIEEVFGRLMAQSRRRRFAIKTTEAPHYRRFLIQQRKDRPQMPPGAMRMVGTNDGKGVMFVSHIGEIFPSGFLPVECGRFPKDSVVDVYQNSSLFKSLRDPDQLGGKCGVCDYRSMCGGSRARSYAMSGDPLAAEPDCVYVPQALELVRIGS